MGSLNTYESKVNLIGNTYGMLYVIGKVGDKWLCECECLEEIEVSTSSLIEGKTSCGCDIAGRDI